MLLGLALLLLPACDGSNEDDAATAGPTANWPWHESEAGRFKVRFPIQPTVDSTTGPGGPGTSPPVMTTAAADGVLYRVTFTDFDGDLVRPSRAVAMLNAARDETATQINGTVVDEQTIDLSGHAGRAYRIEAATTNGPIVIDTRIYLVGSRLYQQSVVRSGDAEIDDIVTGFMGSLRLVE